MLGNRTLALHAGVAVVVTVLSAGCARTEATEAFEDNEGIGAVRSPFESGAGKSAAAGAGKTADDLVERGLLIGKTRTEVKRLLGDPDQEDRTALGYFVYAGAGASVRLAYVVRVEFDPNGEVARDAYFDGDAGSAYSGTN